MAAYTFLNLQSTARRDQLKKSYFWTLAVIGSLLVIMTGFIAFKSDPKVKFSGPDSTPQLKSLAEEVGRIADSVEKLESRRSATMEEFMSTPPAPPATPDPVPAPSVDPAPVDPVPTPAPTKASTDPSPASGAAAVAPHVGGTVRREEVKGDYTADAYAWKNKDGSRGARATLYKGDKPEMDLSGK